jgi:hypothetical protein
VRLFHKMEIRCQKRMGNAGKSYRGFWIESNCNGFEKTERNNQKDLIRPKLALIQQRRITQWESSMSTRSVIAKMLSYDK